MYSVVNYNLEILITFFKYGKFVYCSFKMIKFINYFINSYQFEKIFNQS